MFYSLSAMHKQKRNSGFTLAELAIVVLILGILAAVGVPKIINKSAEAEAVAFARELMVFVDASDVFYAYNGEWPIDSSSGQLGNGNPFGEYLSGRQWVRPTPLGGVWDFENNDSGVTAAVGVHFYNTPNPTVAFMTEIDAVFDDGNVTTGAFRRLATDRYYYILEE